jgi:hypothetical protein
LKFIICNTSTILSISSRGGIDAYSDTTSKLQGNGCSLKVLISVSFSRRISSALLSRWAGTFLKSGLKILSHSGLFVLRLYIIFQECVFAIIMFSLTFLTILSSSSFPSAISGVNWVETDPLNANCVVFGTLLQNRHGNNVSGRKTCVLSIFCIKHLCFCMKIVEISVNLSELDT